MIIDQRRARFFASDDFEIAPDKDLKEIDEGYMLVHWKHKNKLQIEDNQDGSVTIHHPLEILDVKLSYEKEPTQISI